MRLSKEIETLCFEIENFIDGNSSFVTHVANINSELKLEPNITRLISKVPNAQLNRVWHATRALDSTMRMFLMFHHVSLTDYSIGAYINKLQIGGVGFDILSGTLANKMKNEIVEKRNKYAHAAGSFPSKGEADYLVSQVHEAIITVLGLKYPK